MRGTVDKYLRKCIDLDLDLGTEGLGAHADAAARLAAFAMVPTGIEHFQNRFNNVSQHWRAERQQYSVPWTYVLTQCIDTVCTVRVLVCTDLQRVTPAPNPTTNYPC